MHGKYCIVCERALSSLETYIIYLWQIFWNLLEVFDHKAT